MYVSKKSNGEILLSTKTGTITIQPEVSVTVKNEQEEVIDWAGEYEISGCSVRAFSSSEGTISFRVGLEGVRLFSPTKSVLITEEERSEIGDIDVLFVFAESSEWTKKDWKAFLEEVDPRMVIFGEKGEKTTALQKEIGEESVESVEKTEIAKGKFLGEKTVFLSLV